MTQRYDNNSNGQFWPGKANKVPDVEIQYLKQMGNITNRYSGILQQNKWASLKLAPKHIGIPECNTKTNSIVLLS